MLFFNYRNVRIDSRHVGSSKELIAEAACWRIRINKIFKKDAFLLCLTLEGAVLLDPDFCPLLVANH